MRRGPLLAATLLLLAAAAASAGVYPCSEAGLEQAIAEACPAGNTVITFDCSPGSVIPLRVGRGGSHREIPAGCDGVVIDGEGQVTFDQSPPWWQDGDHCVAPAYDQSCDPDGDGVPDHCPELEGGERFLMIRGDETVVRNLGYRNFWEGIAFDDGTRGNRLEGVTCDKPGDDCFTNEWETRDNALVGSTFTNACDKAISLYGRNVATSSGFDLVMENNTLVNAITSISLPGGADRGGRFLIRGNTFTQEDPSSLWRCDNVTVRSTSVVHFEDNRIEGCKRGLRAKDEAHLIATGNEIRGCGLRGAWIYGNARAHFEGNTIEGNGGASGSNSYYGGIALSASATVDAGGGSLVLDGVTRSSAGGNTLVGNRGPSTPALDLHNTTSGTVKAEGNCWGDADPSDQVQGPVDWTPLGSDCGGGEPNTPPATPGNLERTDRKSP
jgi:hypothetical protein